MAKRGDGLLRIFRKPGESLRIGDDIQIHITSVKDGEVRLDVKAPRSIAVWREEIYQRVRFEPGQESMESKLWRALASRASTSALIARAVEVRTAGATTSEAALLLCLELLRIHEAKRIKRANA